MNDVNFNIHFFILIIDLLISNTKASILIKLRSSSGLGAKQGRYCLPYNFLTSIFNVGIVSYEE